MSATMNAKPENVSYYNREFENVFLSSKLFKSETNQHTLPENSVKYERQLI